MLSACWEVYKLLMSEFNVLSAHGKSISLDHVNISGHQRNWQRSPGRLLMDNFKASVAQSDICSLQLIKIVVGCDHYTIEERSSWMNSFRFSLISPQATSAASLNEHGAIYNGILPNLWGRKYLS